MPARSIQIERLTEASERGFTTLSSIWVLRVGCLVGVWRLVSPGCFIPSVPGVSLDRISCPVEESLYSESHLSKTVSKGKG